MGRFYQAASNAEGLGIGKYNAQRKFSTSPVFLTDSPAIPSDQPQHELGWSPRTEEKRPKHRSRNSRYKIGLHRSNRPHYKSSSSWVDQTNPPDPPIEAPSWTYQVQARLVLDIRSKLLPILKEELRFRNQVLVKGQLVIIMRR
jgi:hypothetical protein